eukprot:sb/3471856/
MNAKTGPYFNTKVSLVCLAINFLSNATSFSLIGSPQESQSSLTYFFQISDQVGTKQPPCIIRIPSKKTQQTAAGLIFERGWIRDMILMGSVISRLISSVRRYGMWNMIRGSSRYEIRFGECFIALSIYAVVDLLRQALFTKSSPTAPNHVPHTVSSHTANGIPRIISFVSRIVSLC